MCKLLLIGVAALSVLGASTAHAQTNGTLTLACQGVVESHEFPKKQVSLGIVVNFTTKTVEGFGDPLRITRIDETGIGFDDSGLDLLRVLGAIDRITGETTVFTYRPIAQSFFLKCKPAQRMF